MTSAYERFKFTTERVDREEEEEEEEEEEDILYKIKS